MNIKFLRAAASNGMNSLSELFKQEGHSVKKLKIQTRYTGRPTDIIINWGSSSRKTLKSDLRIINNPDAVAIASDKVKTFQTLQEAGMNQYLPKWTCSTTEAVAFINQDLEKVYCRTLTRGSEGRGIQIASTVEELVNSPLYTCRVDTDRELRLHVCNGTVIDFAQKKKMSTERREEEGIEDVDMEIRSHSRGWVFARQGVTVPDNVKQVAIDAVAKIGLDFGAVDLAITRQGTVKIFEVNTAPGLEGTTLTSYFEALKGLL